MKALSIFFALFISPFTYCQNNFDSDQTIPECQIKTLDGTPFNTSEIGNGQNPFIICFWQSCCNSNLKFMESFNDIYEELVEDTGVKVFAISVDDSRSADKIKPLVNGKGWEFDFLLDPNSDFKRIMNVNLTPHCMIYDGKKNLVWQKMGFVEGDVYEIQDVLEQSNLEK
nr:TlpA family protein disulfide reductase [Bacteroidota bacterium]